MAAINLLSTQLGSKSKYSKAASSIKQGVIYASIFCLLLGLMGAGAIIYLNAQLRSTVNAQSQAKTQIKSLSQAEAGLILLKDRIKKTSAILKEDQITEQIIKLQKVLGQLPATVSLSEANMDSINTELTFQAENSLGLTQLLSSVVSLGDYEEVNMESLNYNPTLGYVVTLVVK